MSVSNSLDDAMDLLAVTAGALVVSGTGCRRGGLAYWADRARAQGLTSISYAEIVCVIPGTLADAVDDWTVLVAEPVSSPATQTHTDSDISTWHLLRVTEVLRHRGGSRQPARDRRPRMRGRTGTNSPSKPPGAPPVW